MANITGTAGPDALPDTSGADSILGLGGNDTITLTGGADTADGGAGVDVLILNYAGQTQSVLAFENVNGSGDGNGAFGSITTRGFERFDITTGSGNDNIFGANDIYAPLGADHVSTGAGDDFVGGFGRATLDLGSGFNGADIDRRDATAAIVIDTTHGTYSGVSGLSGSLNYIGQLITGSGNDSITLGAGVPERDQSVFTGAGDDTITVSGGVDTVAGEAGNDVLVADYSAATHAVSAFQDGAGGGDLYGGGAGFVQFSGIEVQSITSGSGADSILGGAGEDTISTGAAADTLDGGAGADVLIGGSGSDTYYVDNPFDQVVEGVGGGTGDVVYTSLSDYGTALNVESLHYTGTGRFHGSTFNGALYADGASSASLLGGDGARLYGGAGDDTLQHRGTGSAQMYGGDGNDHFVINYGDGTATISGGGGFDLFTDTAATAANLTIDLTKVGFQAIGDGAVIQQIEQLHFTGGSGNDFERGGAAADVLKGGAGSDTLIGGGGADTLEGDAGHDTLTGGDGADTFRFYGPPGPGDDDTVTDFVSGVDKVVLGFGLGGGAQPFDVVTAADGPFEAKATVIVDTANHTLSFDRDGTGAGAAVLVAHGDFTTNPSDYMVI